MDTIFNAVVTLVAAFGGAYLAFMLERRSKQAALCEEEIGWGNQALFTLARIWSKQQQYRLVVVDEVRGDPLIWYSLPIATAAIGPELSFDPRQLSFVLRRNVSTFSAVIVESDRVQQVNRWIEERNQLMLTEVHPILVANGFQQRTRIAVETLEGILGAARVQYLKVLTKAIVEQIELNLVSSKTAFDALSAELKALHPKSMFIPFPVDGMVAHSETNNAASIRAI